MFNEECLLSGHPWRKHTLYLWGSIKGMEIDGTDSGEVHQDGNQLLWRPHGGRDLKSCDYQLRISGEMVQTEATFALGGSGGRHRAQELWLFRVELSSD